jgi:dipeptidyl aminopeptidase/acylaminoacyl peptidase
MNDARAPRRRRVFGYALALAAVALFGAAPATAFPGLNGKIAFSTFRDGNYETYGMSADGTGVANISNHPDFDYGPAWSPDGSRIAFRTNRDDTTEIYVMSANGTGATRLTTNTAWDGEPAWSPDGTRIAFTSERDGNREIYVMNADGTGQVDLTNNAAGQDQKPAWSPDGAKIAFWTTRAPGGDEEVYVMNSDGSGQTNLTPDPNISTDFQPSWSPDGSKIAFVSFRDGNGEIYEMHADGSAQTRVTTNTSLDYNPTWAPDGTALAFGSLRDGNWEIYRMNPDGTAQTNLTNNPADDEVPDWQPAFRGYPRPAGASPVYAPLVIAFKPCEAPDRVHATPLAGASCSAFSQTSDQLTGGTIDANGKAVKFQGFVRLKVLTGNPATPADEADVKLTMNMVDVRRQSDLEDYTGETQVQMSLRLTDRANGTGAGAFPAGTTTGIVLAVTTPCVATADTTVGSTCDIATTADSVIPGAVAEGKRAVWQMGQVQVLDGGPDGLASTPDNNVFAVQGLVAP